MGLDDVLYRLVRDADKLLLLVRLGERVFSTWQRSNGDDRAKIRALLGSEMETHVALLAARERAKATLEHGE